METEQQPDVEEEVFPTDPPFEKSKSVGGKLSPKKIQVQMRQTQALEMRMAGATFVQIAERLNYKNPMGARKAVEAGILRHVREPSETARELELERLDRLLMRLWPRAMSPKIDPPDYQAVDRVMSIMSRRAKLMGLDAPQRVDITGWVRDMAQQEGLDPDRAVKDAEEIIRKSGWSD